MKIKKLPLLLALIVAFFAFCFSSSYVLAASCPGGKTPDPNTGQCPSDSPASGTSGNTSSSKTSGIINPVLSPILGQRPDEAASGTTTSFYIILIWRMLIIIGGLAVLLNFVVGAINWITAGGDASKITKARQQIINAVIGMVILAFSFIIIGNVMRLFGVEVLKFTFPTPS